jgi:serine/threonine-protein kinase
MEKKRSTKVDHPPAAKQTMAKDTKVVRETVVPDEQELLWQELGSTRIVEHDDTDVVDPRECFPVNRGNPMKLGDFQLEEKLGEGAMGEVYKALQVSLNGEKLETPRTVALKVLFPHICKIPKLVKRLQREAEVLGLLDHPNIVQAYAIDESDGRYFVAMEFVLGKSMQKWLDKQPLTVEDAVTVTLACAEALAYAHKAGVIHRDIKPDNILVTADGTVKLADFGMVKIDEEEENALTQTGHAVGTPWYMPLEQARNAKEIDLRSDIYALGCTLYAFLTGRPPFAGRTIVEVIQAKEHGTFPPARRTNNNVPAHLDEIIFKMTHKQPKLRFQNCAELIAALETLNLARPTLSFLQDKPPPDKVGEDRAVAMMKGTVHNSLSRSKAPELAAPAVDATIWYVRVKTSSTKVTRRFTTAELLGMIAEGKVKPSAQASHSPHDGFRAVATYQEFQGVTSKQGADKTASQLSSVLKQIEATERKREGMKQDAPEESDFQVNARYWMDIFLKVLPYAAATILFIAILYLVYYLISIAVG